MYRFERFSDDAKRVLTLAQEEAERSHHSYIGTEHLLLGLLRLEKGSAHDVLTELGIDIGEVRRTIASVLSRNERVIIQQTIPTSRVKKVIEISFEEARRMGHEYVSSGHLLMGLVIEGEGIAAHVLQDLGATPKKVVAAVEHNLAAEPPRVPKRFYEMRTVAGLPRESGVSDAETLLRLLNDPRIAAVLRGRGLDVEALVRALQTPPESVLNVRGQLAVARSHLADAVNAADYERAAQVQRIVKRLTEKLATAEEDWLGSLGR